MFQKIANVLSILSFIMVTSVIGGGYFGYKYVTSEQFKAKMMNQVMGNVKGMLPNVMITHYQKQQVHLWLYLR